MNPKIIITLTTVPNRLTEPKDHMGARLGIKTLLEQSYNDYEVYLNIPLVYKRTNDKMDVPEWLTDYSNRYPHLKIFRTEDYGPITKILPTLQNITDPETIIITADDDLYYMDGLIEAHLAARQKYPNAALGFAGITAIDGSCHFCTTVASDTRVKVLEGYKTVSYLRGFFDLQEFTNNFVDKTWNDDAVISAYMGFKNIPKIVLTYDKDTDFTPRVESFPVIAHTPIERGGCNVFRNCDESQRLSDDSIKKFYELGYLER